MRPHDARSPRRGAAGAARTRLRVKLGWLGGFPLGEPDSGAVPWLAFSGLGSRDGTRVLTVDRERLRSSSYARNALPRRFPRALASVVGDIEAWGGGVDTRLEYLKDGLHRGTALPELDRLLRDAGTSRTMLRRIQSLNGRAPGVGHLLTALAWQRWGDDEGWSAVLDVLETRLEAVVGLLGRRAELAHSKSLERLGVPPAERARVVALVWCDATASGVAPGFLQLLADPRSWSLPTREGDFVGRQRAALRRRRDGEDETHRAAHGFDRPPPRLALEWIDALVDTPARGTVEAPRRRGRPDTHLRRLHLASLLVGREQLDGWEAWWQRAEAAERETRRLLGRRDGGPSLGPDIAAWDSELRALPPAPTVVEWRDIAHLVDAGAAAASQVFTSLVEALEAMPARPGGRAARRNLLFNWSRALVDPRTERVLHRVLSAQRDLLRSFDFDDEQLWWVSEGLVDDLYDAFVGEGAGVGWIDPFRGALSEWIRRGPSWREHTGPFRSWEGVRLLVEVVRTCPDSGPGPACDLFAALDASEEPLEREVWRVLQRLGAADTQQCAALARSWSGEWAGYEVRELGRASSDEAVRPHLVELLRAGESAQLRRALRWSRLLRRLAPAELDGAWHPAPLDPDTDWARYPAELHEVLSALAEHEGDAERAAARTLAKDFPDPDRVRRELESLQERLARGDASPGMTRRARALAARLDAPRTPSPARMKRLRERLMHRARKAWLHRVGEQLSERARAAIGVSTLRSTIRDDADSTPTESAELLAVFGAVFGAVAELDPAPRALAQRLLQVRSGAPPWDLRHHPTNQAFLARMADRGLDPAPWLDGLGPRVVTGPNGEEWQLDLEVDPLEVLRMGEPFSTCLAPGAFNFFSAVTNAADINKRVLHARDGDRTIRGRCLLALTRAGDLLAFRVYAHDGRDALEDAVRSYVSELARRIGCEVVPRGSVETLVASDWYDDGPVDLAGPPSFLAADSAFRRRLPELPPNRFVEALEQASGTSPTPALIWALLQSGVLADRPEFVATLLPFLPDDPIAIDPWTRLQVVELLVAAGQSGHARRQLDLLDHRASAYDDPWTAGIAAARAAEYWTTLERPQRAMRILRRTRARGVRGWEDDTRPRVVAAARATRALHRPHRALDLFRIAKAMGVVDVDTEVAALEMEIGA